MANGALKYCRELRLFVIVLEKECVKTFLKSIFFKNGYFLASFSDVKMNKG